MEVNFSNQTIRRDDWKHTSTSPLQKVARRVPLSAIKEKPIEYDYTPAVKHEVHPLRMPKMMEPSQVDWRGGREYHDRKNGNVRLVPAAEVDELVGWGLEKIRLRYPRVQSLPLANWLKQACRGGEFHFLRTDNGCGLFQLERTVWEPLPVVKEIFVIIREPKPGAFDARRLYSAAMAWADEIGAVEFQYGGSTGVDITPIARKIGYENRRYEFCHALDPKR